MVKSQKKPKEKKLPPKEASTTPTTAASNSNVFGSLFGEIPEENSEASIFSDSNPFRRKPSGYSQASVDQKKDLGLGFETPDAKEMETYEDSDGSAEQLKKRKRRDNEGRSDGDEVTPFEEKYGNMKKLKRVQSGKEGSGRRKGNVGLEGEEKDVNGVSSGMILNGENGKGGNLEEAVVKRNGINADKKKKRKRDEVEAEYEARRYGVEEEEEVVEEEGGVVGRKRKTMDSLKDVMVESKEGFDDESKLLRTVFVGNLPLKIKKKVLIREFGKFGEVESVRIRSIPLNDSKLPRKGAIIRKQINETVDSVHAYVVFKTEESAQASLAHNMAVVGGNHIRVDRACPPRKKLKGDNSPLYDNKRTVFVGNLPFDVKDEELYKLFSSIKDMESSIEAIRIVRDPGTSLGKGIAYVLFKTKDAANLVVRKRQVKLRDRDLRLYHSKAGATPSKRQNPFPAETNALPNKKIGVHSKFTDPENKIKSRSLAYQGLKASKSGIQKKTHGAAKLNLDSQKVHVQKERFQKRPAVAARKGKVLKDKQTGFKRKLEKQTPDTIGQKKKARKFA